MTICNLSTQLGTRRTFSKTLCRWAKTAAGHKPPGDAPLPTFTTRPLRTISAHSLLSREATAGSTVHLPAQCAKSPDFCSKRVSDDPAGDSSLTVFVSAFKQRSSDEEEQQAGDEQDDVGGRKRVWGWEGMGFEVKKKKSANEKQDEGWEGVTWH